MRERNRILYLAMENVIAKSGSMSKGALWALVLALPVVLIAASGGVYFILLASLVTLALLYVATSGKFTLSRIFDAPVYLTAFVLLNFGFAPLEALWKPENMEVDLHGDVRVLSRALGLVLAGMIAFWAGAKLIERRRRERYVIPQEDKAGRIVAVAIILYLIGFVAKFYLLKAHLFAYTADLELYQESLADAQVFNFLAQFATIGLVMLGIEKFGGKPRFAISALFWTVFFSECIWGLISGMKSMLLANFIAVAVVSTLMGGKLAKKWVITAGLALVLIYPLYNAYRSVVRGQAAEDVTGFGAAARALNVAMTVGSQAENSNEWVESGSTSALSRLDLLQYFGVILNLGPQASDIHGDGRLWMIPFYPFVPRIFWSSKPQLDDTSRFSEVLGFPKGTSTAITYPADCYIWAGIPGILMGMFVLGIFAQRYTNSVSGVTTKYQVFKYSVVLLTCFRVEFGVVELWTALLKIVPALFVLGWLAYGAKARKPVVSFAKPELSSGPNLGFSS
jgi:hypothetical protein